jgi:transposase
VEEVSALSLQGAIPGPTFDASVLETTEQQTHFHRNLHAVTAILEGKTLVQVAQAHGMSVSTLGRLVQRTKALGQIACVPYGTYYRNRALHPEFQQLLRKLYTHAMRPTIMAVYEDVRLKRLAEELSEREGRLVRLPTYRQVWSFLNEIRSEARVAQARSGLKHAPHERMSSQSFVLSISSPALICQVDEHVFDQLIVASDGTILTRRVHGAVLICVKTAAILGVALRKLSPGAE